MSIVGQALDDVGLARNRNGIVAIGVRNDRSRVVVGLHGVDVRKLDFRVQALVPVHDLARVRREPTEDGRHRALGAVFGFVWTLATSQGGKQIVMLLLVTLAFALGAPDQIAGSVVDLTAADVRLAWNLQSSPGR